MWVIFLACAPWSIVYGGIALLFAPNRVRINRMSNPLNRTCELSGISKSYTGEVTIPSNVNGFLVTKIKNSACLQ